MFNSLVFQTEIKQFLKAFHAGCVYYSCIWYFLIFSKWIYLLLCRSFFIIRLLGFTLNCILAQLTSNILFSCSLIPVDVLGHSESEKYIVKVSFDVKYIVVILDCGNTWLLWWTSAKLSALILIGLAKLLFGLHDLFCCGIALICSRHLENPRPLLFALKYRNVAAAGHVMLSVSLPIQQQQKTF